MAEAPAGKASEPEVGATARLPAALAEIVDDFAAVSPRDRLALLLELSQSLPALPERLSSSPHLLEQVHECQTPLFVATELRADGTVGLFFSAPQEAPTTRGFAGILHAGLDSARAEDVLAVPDDFYRGLGLAEAVSPLRLRGMAAMLARVKRQVRAALAHD